MRVLLVGSGGREGALALGLAASPSLEALHIAPGNPGTAALGTNHAVAADDIEGLVALARRESVGLAIVGPELPLSLGIADAFAAAGIACFGPSALASRIESSKAFSKAFMDRHGIPTAAARVFTDPAAARAWVSALPSLPVIKASGLAAGKGVVVPSDLPEALDAVDRLAALGGQGSELLVEERLEGEEVSVIALCDGSAWTVLPTARDHKRLLEGDRGPNTGGMGSYAPATSAETARALAELVIAPVVAGLAAEGSPFVGALFAGVMLCADGPRVLEYNCRLGDPESQVILPLLDGDLAALLGLAATGRLASARPRWKRGAAACIVIAAEGYPEAPRRGLALSLPVALPEDSWLLHAGTELSGAQLRSSGGRVMNAVGYGADLDRALARARAVASAVGLEGALWRRDIGARGSIEGAAAASLAAAASIAAAATLAAEKGRSEAAPAAKPAPPSAYAAAGVDIDAGNRAVALMRAAVTSTYGPEVLAGIGSFGGLYDASALAALDRPVLVASTDGVGTKTSLGLSLRRLRGLGQDIVNHSIDDILVQGARPLFFLDYFAAASLVPEDVAEVVGGMADACRAAGCALLGGETAEMPGTYRQGEIDIAGTIVGVVEAGRVLPRADLAAGDLLVGLPSSGLHTNGFSLARRALAGLDLEALHPALGESLADALLRPHLSYLPLLWPALSASPSPVKALAHITGGGFVENLPRILPRGLEARVLRGSWPIPPLFGLIQSLASVPDAEMARVFNLGIGMVAIVAPPRLEAFRSLVECEVHVIGELAPGARGAVVS